MKTSLTTDRLAPGSPVNKRDYFDISSRRGLPMRCPILEQCERRRFTIRTRRAEDGEYMVTPPIPLEPVVPMIEDACKVGGNNNFFVRCLCPEVALFEHSDAMPGFAGMPMTSGEYDKYFDVPYHLLDTGHFSECAEYVQSERDQAAGKAGKLAMSTENGGALSSNIISSNDVTFNLNSFNNREHQPTGKSVFDWLALIFTVVGLMIAIAVWLYGDSILN